MSDGPYGRHGFSSNANAGYGGQGGGASYGSQGGGYAAPSYGQSYGGGSSYGGAGGQDYGSQYGSYGGGAPDNYQVCNEWIATSKSISIVAARKGSHGHLPCWKLYAKRFMIQKRFLTGLKIYRIYNAIPYYHGISVGVENAFSKINPFRTSTKKLSASLFAPFQFSLHVSLITFEFSPLPPCLKLKSQMNRPGPIKTMAKRERKRASQFRRWTRMSSCGPAFLRDLFSSISFCRVEIFPFLWPTVVWQECLVLVFWILKLSRANEPPEFLSKPYSSIALFSSSAWHLSSATRDICHMINLEIGYITL